MENEHPLEVHSPPPKDFVVATGRFGRFYTRRSRHVSTLNTASCTVKEGENPSYMPEVLDAKPSELPLQMHEAISLHAHCSGCSSSSHPLAQSRPFDSLASPFHAATRRRAIRSRRTDFDLIILPIGLRKLTAREMDASRCRRARKILTDERLAAARAKETVRRRNARLNQTAEQKAATRAMDTARKRASRQRLKQAKMMIKDDDCNDHISQVESVNKPPSLSSRERATIRKRNQRLKQTAEQRAATRALETARRRASRQRLREAKMMLNNDHGNTHIIQSESVDNPA